MNKHIITGLGPCNHTPVTALWWAALHHRAATPQKLMSYVHRVRLSQPLRPAKQEKLAGGEDGCRAMG